MKEKGEIYKLTFESSSFLMLRIVYVYLWLNYLYIFKLCEGMPRGFDT